MKITMLVDMPRRWRWVVGISCAVLVLLEVLLLTLAQPAGAANAVAMSNSTVAIQAPRPVSVSTSERSTLAARLVASAPHGEDEVRVCGGGWVKLRPDGSPDPEEVDRVTRSLQSPDKILSRLRSSGDELQRATALMLAMVQEPGPEAQTPEGVRARDALARLASVTSDPKVYGLAFRVCGSGRGERGACQLLSAEQWARLDPDNAAPWFFIIGDAKTRNDPAARDEALHHIANAKRSQSGFFDAAGAILDVAPQDDVSQLAAMSLIVQAIGLEAAGSAPGYQPLAIACKGPALKDANRWQTCAAIADVMTERSDSLLERGIGARIGLNSGWSQEQEDRLRGQADAYRDAIFPSESADKGLGCSTLRQQMGTLRRHARLGEAGALREWVANSGKSPEDFIRTRRASQREAAAHAERVKQAQAASAAALGPSGSVGVALAAGPDEPASAAR